MVSTDQSKGSNLVKRLQYSISLVEAIALQGDISFRKLFAKNSETSDGYFIKLKSFIFIEKGPISVKNYSVQEETNRHSNTAIKFVGDANETIYTWRII